MPDPSNQRSPLGAAMEWVGRILAAAAVMVLPGLLGKWLDDRWGTGFLVLVGFALGMSLGLYYLIVVTKPRQHRDSTRSDQDSP